MTDLHSDRAPLPGSGSRGQLEQHRAAHQLLLDRLVLPIVLPLISVIALATIVINLSRILLATGSSGAVITALVFLVLILVVAATISAHPRIRTSSLVMTVAVLVLASMAAGLVAVAPSRPAAPAAATGYREPSGPPIFRLQVDALPSLHFQATQFTVPAGIIQINYIDFGGTHTLVFDDPRFAGFELEVPAGQHTGKVRLTPGDYLIYCTEPGHRAAGMQATIHVP